MGLRFRKSIKLAPGVRLNLGKKSAGISFGGKGVRHTISTSGRRTTTVGIPGSGLSYSHTSGGKKSKTSSAKREIDMKKTSKQKVKKPITKRWWFYPLIVCLVLGGIGNACGDKDADKQAEEAPVAAVEEETEVIPETTTEEVEEERELGDPVGEVVFAPITYGDEEQETEQEETHVVTTDKTEVTTDNAQTTTDTTTNEQPIEEEPVVETPAETTPIVEEPIGTTYVLNTNTMKFHYSTCSSVGKIKDGNKGTYTGSRDDLIAQGYTACGNCHP